MKVIIFNEAELRLVIDYGMRRNLTGGFENLAKTIYNLTNKVTGRVELSGVLCERIVRYATSYGPGGWNDSYLKPVFGRHFDLSKPPPKPIPEPELPLQESAIEIVLTASVKTIPLVVTIWKYPSGDVTQVVYDKAKLATLPQAMRITLEKAWATLEDLRGHRGEIIDS